VTLLVSIKMKDLKYPYFSTSFEDESKQLITNT